MRGIRILALALGVAALGAAAPEKTKVHGNAVAGIVTRIDAAAKTFVVRAGSGKEATLARTAATRINGETLRVGDRVAVRWLERDGRKVATSIRIEPSVAGATPTAPPAPAAP